MDGSKGAELQVTHTGGAVIPAGYPFRRCGPQCTHFKAVKARSRGVSYVWLVVFSPPFLILWFWPVVLLYIIIIIEPHVFRPLVLVIYGIDP